MSGGRLVGRVTRARAPKGAPTSLNVSVLAEVFAVPRGVERGIEPRFPGVHQPHIKRCLEAGLCAVDLSRGLAWLRLTDAGLEATREGRAAIFFAQIQRNTERLYSGALTYEAFGGEQAAAWAAANEDPACGALVLAKCRERLPALPAPL